MELKYEVWVIMSKDRSIIAKGTPRNRYLCKINESNKRILTYQSKAKAESAFKNNGFYGGYNHVELEVVKMIMILKGESVNE